MDVSKFGEGLIQIGHTQKRVDELTDALGQVLEANSLSAKDSERLRGRMNFFEGYAFGRGPAQAVKVLDSQARGGLLKSRLTEEASSALKILMAKLASARSLEISLKSSRTWYLFTDGAYENIVGTVGAVLYDEAGVAQGVFGAKAPDSFMRQVLAYSKNSIYELDILPVLLSLRVRGKLLHHGQIVSYLDDEAAKVTLIKSSGATPLSERPSTRMPAHLHSLNSSKEARWITEDPITSAPSSRLAWPEPSS